MGLVLQVAPLLFLGSAYASNDVAVAPAPFLVFGFLELRTPVGGRRVLRVVRFYRCENLLHPEGVFTRVPSAIASQDDSTVAKESGQGWVNRLTATGG